MTYLNALPQSLVTTLNLADRVATGTTAAADRAIVTYRWLTQPQAIATYRWLGRMALALVELIIWSAIWAYAQVTKRFESKPQFISIVDSTPEHKAKVSSAIADLTDAELEAEFNDSFEPDFYEECQPYIEAQPQAMTAPIATLRLAPSTSHEDGLDREYELADMTLKQLVPIAAALSLPTRKVRKTDLIDSILAAEGYKI